MSTVAEYYYVFEKSRFLNAGFNFSFPVFPSRDELLEARSLQRSCFEMAQNKKERAREACDLLLLSLYCHIPLGSGSQATGGRLRSRTSRALRGSSLPKQEHCTLAQGGRPNHSRAKIQDVSQR